MNVTFRKYEKNDFETLSRMILALYTEDPDGEPVTIDNIKLTVEEAGLHPSKLDIIIFEGGSSIIGYAILTFFWSNEHGGDIINIDEIYVEPPYRSKGISSAFIESLEERYPKSIGLKLEASQSNKRAIKGYERMGFRPAPNYHMLKYPLNKV